MTSEMIACEGYCYASTCPRWAPCHKQWEGAEREAKATNESTSDG